MDRREKDVFSGVDWHEM